VAAIGAIQIKRESQKAKDKSIENARKRIKEREKMEKDKKSEQSEPDKEKNK